MEKVNILRSILAKNIKKARSSLHISQVKLAEAADISVPHMLDIEYCKSWVSDKTLNNIARALNIEAYELLIPEKDQKDRKPRGKNDEIQQAATIINSKKKELRRKMGEVMDDLILDITKIYRDKEK
ncbi:MAG: helix-turn-helix domain-containing protein [Treponema sp.]|nr:helix-turn-helix domain-containing protein [Treponema sp.]